MQRDGNLLSINYLIKLQQQFKPLNQGLKTATKMGLQSALGWSITKCSDIGLQSLLGIGLQRCVKMDYKVR